MCYLRIVRIRFSHTADLLRSGAKDILNSANKKVSRKYKLGPKSKRKQSDE